MKRKKKVEFSKKIFAGVTIGTIIVIIFSMIVIWRTYDTSALGYLIGGVFAELATATGFYYNKAKAENQIKISKQYKDLGLNQYENYNDENYNNNESEEI